MLVELMIKINADNEVVDISEQAEMLPDRLLDRLIAYFHPRREFNITFSMSRGRFNVKLSAHRKCNVKLSLHFL